MIAEHYVFVLTSYRKSPYHTLMVAVARLYDVVVATGKIYGAKWSCTRHEKSPSMGESLCIEKLPRNMHLTGMNLITTTSQLMILKRCTPGIEVWFYKNHLNKYIIKTLKLHF